MQFKGFDWLSSHGIRAIIPDHGREMETIKLPSGCSCTEKLVRSSNIS